MSEAQCHPQTSSPRPKAVPVAALTLAVIGAIYGRLVVSDPLLKRDDLHILAHLKTPAQAWGLLRSGAWGEFVAYQPLKDFTLLVDQRVSGALGLGTFHFSNLLIWGAILWVLSRLLRRHHPDDPMVPAALALFAVHPLFVGSVAWVAARKHLLAALFTLLATDSLVAFENSRRGPVRAALKVALFYTLAILCHPLPVLWPVWATIYLALSSRREAEPLRESRKYLAIALAVPILIVGALANWAYYSGLYTAHTSSAKLVGSPGAAIGISFLALGRYFFNFVAPVRLATSYYPGSIPNLMGVITLPFVGWWVLRRASWRESLRWSSFTLLMLAPVLVQNTNIFVSDTYALAGALGVLELAILVVPRKPAIWTVVWAAWAAISFVQARSWRSDVALWGRAYQVEPSPRVLSVYAEELQDIGLAERASRVTRELVGWGEHAEWVVQLEARATYLDLGMSVQERIRRLAMQPGPWAAYYRGSLHATDGSFGAAYESLLQALSAPDAFSSDLPIVAAEAEYFCRRSGRRECSEIAGKVLATRNPASWDQGRYLSRLEELER